MTYVLVTLRAMTYDAVTLIAMTYDAVTLTFLYFQHHADSLEIS